MSTAQKTDGHRAAKSGPTISPKLITVVVIVVAAVWFIIVNKQRVDIYLWIPHITAPMWLILVLTFAAGLIAGLLLRRNGNQQGNGKR